MTTSQYIYRALFQEGQNSDVTLIALGKEWKLHKVYLCQSAYFASMFSGAWKESSEDIIHIEILDPNINLDGIIHQYNLSLTKFSQDFGSSITRCVGLSLSR